MTIEDDYISHRLNLIIKRVVLCFSHVVSSARGNVVGKIIEILSVDLQILVYPICCVEGKMIYITFQVLLQLFVHRSNYPRVGLSAIKRTREFTDAFLMSALSDSAEVSSLDESHDGPDEGQSEEEDANDRIQIAEPPKPKEQGCENDIAKRSYLLRREIGHISRQCSHCCCRTVTNLGR